MRLNNWQNHLISLPTTENDALGCTAGRADLLWQDDPQLRGLVYQGPLHLGHLVAHTRKQLGLSQDRLVDRVSFGRRIKRLKWLQRLETTGHCSARAKDEFVRALAIDKSKLKAWIAYSGIEDTLARCLSRHSRLVQEGETLTRLNFVEQGSQDLLQTERQFLADNLSFLIENLGSVLKDMRYKACLISQAYLSRNGRSKYSFGLGDKGNEALASWSGLALPLGALLEAWSNNELVIEQTPWNEPLHVVRVVYDDQLSKLWVEGILRKSRRWVHYAFDRNQQCLDLESLFHRLSQDLEDQTPKLWSHFRAYTAYQATLKRFQKVSMSSFDDSEWGAEVNLPGWLASWSNQSIPRLRQSWVQMSQQLERICEKPLTDAIWKTGVPEFDWIPLRSTEHWARWRKRISSGVNDHRARRYYEDSFAEVSSKCVQAQREVCSLPKLIRELKGEDAPHPEYFARI